MRDPARKTLKQSCVDCNKVFMTFPHGRPTTRCDECKKPKPCACGCGKFVKTPKAKFVRGHQRKGQTYGPEYRAAIRKGINQPHVLAAMSHSHSNQSIKQTPPEKMLHDQLDKRKWRFVGAPKMHDGTPNTDLGKDLPVSADIVHRPSHTLIFVDGCYWHECPQHGQGRFPLKPERDAAQSTYAAEQGWRVLRFWEHEIKEDLATVVEITENIR